MVIALIVGCGALTFDRAEAGVQGCQGARPQIDVVIDAEENLYWNCGSIGIENLAPLLRSATRHGLPPNAQIEILADKKGRYGALETVLQEYYAASIRGLRLGGVGPGFSVYPNSVSAPNFSVAVALRPNTPASATPNAMHIQIDFDGTLLLQGQPLSLDALKADIGTALKRNPHASIDVLPHRLTQCGVLMRVLLEIERMGGRNTTVLFRARNGS